MSSRTSFAGSGFRLLRGILASEQVRAWRRALEISIGRPGKRSAGSRNVDVLWPGCIAAVDDTPLPAVVAEFLGSPVGIVRALWFDKSAGSNWSVGWHKDTTVAVRDASGPLGPFRNPTEKEGVPHLEAPTRVLSRMIAARIHLDPVGPESGPLEVAPGSHRDGKDVDPGVRGVTIHAEPGDVLLMSPLLAHRSGRAAAVSTRRRRILHLEFSGDRDLPGGRSWFRFSRVG